MGNPRLRKGRVQVLHAASHLRDASRGHSRCGRSSLCRESSRSMRGGGLVGDDRMCVGLDLPEGLDDRVPGGVSGRCASQQHACGPRGHPVRTSHGSPATIEARHARTCARKARKQTPLGGAVPGEMEAILGWTKARPRSPSRGRGTHGCDAGEGRPSRTVVKPGGIARGGRWL